LFFQPAQYREYFAPLVVPAQTRDRFLHQQPLHAATRLSPLPRQAFTQELTNHEVCLKCLVGKCQLDLWNGAIRRNHSPKPDRHLGGAAPEALAEVGLRPPRSVRLQLLARSDDFARGGLRVGCGYG
jgi:hypothetical protein